ncbi:hypothetical protein OCU04_001083 [Sclerotinia nivalis]|uniref:Uncharacterized protein n=1 Tax=Sclerotinia nivalis TaxID=352851 RepID=A0A9X0DQU4_9HELO|nr:hypothetical protein OCU04_001083 [Sclerotinia nivalis]
MSNRPSLPDLDFGDINITPPSLKRQSQPYIKHSRNATPHETESITQLPSSFSDASSLLDSTSPTPNVSVKSIPSHSQARVRDIRHFFMDYYIHWKWEFSASLFILACPIIIITTLYPYAEQPLPQWPFQISINTLLSIYSLVFKTCLTFVIASCIGQLQWSWFSSHRPLYDLVRYDRATRGPWGSVQLLCSNHIRHPLTGLGAVILIAAVAIDPFIQQLVSPYDCSIALLSLNATLPRTNHFDLEWSRSRNTPGFPVRSAAYTPSTFIDWQCLTGNCTFSQMYGTVAYCSSCEDCSSKLFFETKCYDKEIDANITSATGHCADNLISFVTTSLYTGDDIKPEDSQSGFWVNETIASSTPSMPVFGRLAISTYQGKHNQSSPSEKAYILIPRAIDPVNRFDPNTGVSWTDCNTAVALDTWRCRGYGAAVCSLQPCVRNYNATINGTQLNEQIISSSGASRWGLVTEKIDEFGNLDSWIGMIDTHCLTEEENEILRRQGYKIDGSSQWLAFKRSIVSSHTEENLVSSLLSNHCLYLMKNIMWPWDGSFVYWNEVLGDNFWGDVENESSGVSDGLVNLDDPTGPSMMVDLYNNGYIDFKDVQETFSNISDITSAWIRTHGNSTYSDPAIGEVLHYATCLHVRWPWLAFTATLALLSLAFFIAIVVVTDRQRLLVWKSSPLALMIGGPNAEISSESTLDVIEKKSKKLLVTLVKGSKPHVQIVGKDNGLVDLADGGIRNSISTLRDDLMG